MSSSVSSISTMPSSALRGHTASVLCLAHASTSGAAAAANASQPHLLLSGSEDASVRLWDVRCEKSIRCIKAFGSGEDAAVTAVCFHPKAESQFLAASNQAIYAFDLRNDSQIIVKEAQHRWQHNDEEVNSLCMNASGAYAAAADDNGEVKIIDMDKSKQGQLYKTLRGQHTNLCSSVLFRPKSTWEVWSGGMDCQIIQWDFSRGRPLAVYSTQQSATSASSNQTLNPPFVNSMTFTREGEHLFAGSGNAEIILIDAKKKAEKLRVTGHTHSVMHVGVVPLPPSFPSLQSFTTPNMLLSAGNDHNIMLWDLQALIDTPAAAASSSSSSSSSAAASSSSSMSATTAKNRKKKEKARAKKKAAKAGAATAENDGDEDEKDGDDEEATEAAEAVSSLSIDSAAGDSTSLASAATRPAWSSAAMPATLAFSAAEQAALDTSFIRYRWRHPHKMNAIASAVGMKLDASTSAALTIDPQAPLLTNGVSIYVADTTNDITAYHLK